MWDILSRQNVPYVVMAVNRATFFTYATRCTTGTARTRLSAVCKDEVTRNKSHRCIPHAVRYRPTNLPTISYRSVGNFILTQSRRRGRKILNFLNGLSDPSTGRHPHRRPITPGIVRLRILQLEPVTERLTVANVVMITADASHPSHP